MPSNILRARTSKPVPASAAQSGSSGERVVLIRAGTRQIRARLVISATADRIWAALPLHGVAETWGRSIHIEVPVKSGHERGARINARLGDIYFWAEESRILVPYGETPISRRGEIRLPSPCSLLAVALDDVSALDGATPGEKAVVSRVAA